MRDKNYNTGVRGVLLDAAHYERMGSALWLYSWLILRQTHQSGAIGWVLGGAPVSYREIEEETGFNRRTLEAWFRRLRRAGYIETSAAPSGVVIRITKAKKYSQTTRRVAEGVREVADTLTRTCVAIDPKTAPNEQVEGGIGSSSVVRIKDRFRKREIHKHLHKEIHSNSQVQTQNHSGLEKQTSKSNSFHLHHTDENEIEDTDFQPPPCFSYRARDFLQALRRARDEAARRDAAVGTSPEARRQ